MKTIEEIRLDFSNALRDNNLAVYDQVVVEARAVGTPAAEALVHHALGISAHARSDYPEALESLHRAMGAYKALDDVDNIARVSNGIGNVHLNTGDYPAALEHFHESLASAEVRGDVRGMAIVTSNIGNVNSATGNHQAALELNERAVGMYEQVGEKRGMATTLGNIGNAHAYMLNYPTAMEFYERAMPLQEELGDERGIARTTMNILSVQIAIRNIDESIVLLSKLDAMEITDIQARIGVEWTRAMLQDGTGDHDAATLTMQRILALGREHGLRSQVARASLALRDIAQRRNDFAAYIEHNNEYTRVTEEINGKDTATKLALQEKQREIDAERKEVEKHMAVLHSTLPKHIADRVARGELVNDQFDNAAVMFIDVVGFTTNSGELPAAEVVSLLQNMFTTFDAICAKHGVTKIKTIGDAYMAVAFPTAGENLPGTSSPALLPRHVLPGRFSPADPPRHVPDHHFSLASAAIDIVGSEFTWSHNSTPVQFRIGLHAGPVVAGVLGTERMQYDVWGDTVNVASRMESLGESGRIHVSDIFANALLLAPFKFTPRGEVEVKGKGKMKTFWLRQSQSCDVLRGIEDD